MRTIDLWFVCLQVWIAIWWLKDSGPAWIGVMAVSFLLVGMFYIWYVRKYNP